MKGITSATDKASVGVSKFGLNSTKAMDAVQSQVPGVGSAIGMLANPYMIAAAGAAALGAAAYKSVDMALDWQKGLAKVNVTAQLSKKELGELSEELLSIGENNVAPIEQIPEAFNKIISAGLDVNTSLKVLDPTLKAAKAGFTDVGETGKAAVAVMNSSGRGINEVYDTLFATLNKGNAEFSDVAQYLPKLIPMARNAGFALGETAGAWAYLTAQGQTSERATTLAQNAMKALTDPSKIKAFKDMGIAIYDNTGKIKPLTSIVDALADKTKGLSDLGKTNFFGKIGLDQEAASFFAVAAQDAQKFKDTIDFTTNSQGQLNEAYRNSMTPLDHWNEITNVVKGNMISLGEKALPYINMMGEKILGVIKYFKDLYSRSVLFRDIISAVGDVFGVAFKIANAGLMTIWNGFKNTGLAIDAIISKIPGMGGGIEEFYLKVKPYIIYLKELFGQLADIMLKVTTFDVSGAIDAVKGFKMPSIDDIKSKIASEKESEERKKLEDVKLAQLKAEYDALSGKNGKDIDAKRADILTAMEGTRKGSSKGIELSKISTKLNPSDTGGGSEAKALGNGGGGSSIKNITQKIEIKNYFSVDSSGGGDINGIAEKVVRAINDKLRDGIVAAS